MQCTKPIWLKFDKMFVPCGKCRSCRISRSREWTVRMMHELDSHESAIFLTLTYDPEHMPEDEAIDKRSLQLCLKRIRKRLGERKIKYYASGEYGEQYGRPHYHAIIYGLTPNDREIIQESWPYGMIHIGTVTYDSARYVADYIQKDDRASKYGDRQPPFALQSQGLGKQYALRNQVQLREDLGGTIFGRPTGLPRYYKKILEIPTEVLFEAGREKREEVLKKHEERTQDYDKGELIHPSVIQSRKQANRNILARDNIKNKGRF